MRVASGAVLPRLNVRRAFDLVRDRDLLRFAADLNEVHDVVESLSCHSLWEGEVVEARLITSHDSTDGCCVVVCN